MTPAAPPERPRCGGRPTPRSQVIHYDLRKASAHQIQTFHKVQLHEWFPLQRKLGVDHFYIALQEDFHMAYVNANVSVIAHRVIPLQRIVDLVGEEVRTYLQTVPGLTDLVQWNGLYVLSWVREFFATLWIHPDHTRISFSFLGEQREISSARARELLRIPL
jgi:hypothetical protein